MKRTFGPPLLRDAPSAHTVPEVGVSPCANPYTAKRFSSTTRNNYESAAMNCELNFTNSAGAKTLSMSIEYSFLKALPHAPGVYLMKDDGGRILYVGKAADLRKRVWSYFRPGAELPVKTVALLKKVVKLDTLLTATEKEALLLEASLIKKHKPRYNVVLRDDKQYVLFRLDKSHDYPTLRVVRNVVRDGSVHFGPFTSAWLARQTLKAVLQTFPLRRCSDRAFKNRVRPCLYHYIHLCPAPCVLPVSKEDYAVLVKRVESVLAGRTGDLAARLDADMRAASDALRFEDAAKLRDMKKALAATLERQAAVLPDEIDLDVLAPAQADKGLGLGLIFVRAGRVIDAKRFFWPKLDFDDAPTLLAQFLTQHYAAGRYIPPRILLPWNPDEALVVGGGEPVMDAVTEILADRAGELVKVLYPHADADKRLIALAQTNARDAARDAKSETPLAALAQKLGLEGPLERIEVVDVSHLMGESTRVGALLFDVEHAKPVEHKLYTLPDLGGDDHAALALWVERRAASGPPWPDLLLIDGGKGQLASVERAFARIREDRPDLPEIPLAAIAKGKVDPDADAIAYRHGKKRKASDAPDQIFLPGRKNPAPIAPSSPELFFLQRLRDAVHRFVLGGHRKAQRAKTLTAEILLIPGVGPKTARLLWDRFESLDAVLAATTEELAAIPGLGAKRAAIVQAKLREFAGQSLAQGRPAV